MSSNSSSVTSSTKSTVALFKKSCTRGRQPQKLVVVQLLSLHACKLLLGSLKTLHRLHPHRGHSRNYHYTNSLTVSSYSLNQFDTTALGTYGIYKPVQSLIKLVKATDRLLLSTLEECEDSGTTQRRRMLRRHHSKCYHQLYI